MFFMKPRAGQNRGLYRSTVESEGFAQLFVVQAAMTDQIARDQEHGDLVTVAAAGRRVGIDVENLDGGTLSLGQHRKLRQHLLAQRAVRPGIDGQLQCRGPGAPNEVTE